MKKGITRKIDRGESGKKYSLLYNREQIENREKIWKRGEVMFDIQEELKKLPQKPGVYLMKDENGHIIYVGKAVNLKNRVRQYFQSSRNQTAKTRSMVPNIREFEYIVTDSEMEALLLECNLIQKAIIPIIIFF